MRHYPHWEIRRRGCDVPLWFEGDDLIWFGGDWASYALFKSPFDFPWATGRSTLCSFKDIDCAESCPPFGDFNVIKSNDLLLFISADYHVHARLTVPNMILPPISWNSHYVTVSNVDFTRVEITLWNHSLVPEVKHVYTGLIDQLETVCGFLVIRCGPTLEFYDSNFFLVHRCRAGLVRAEIKTFNDRLYITNSSALLVIDPYDSQLPELKLEP